MSMHLRGIARALGGEVCGRSVRAPGPGHSAKDRSLEISVADAPDGFIVRSYAGDDWRECRDYVRARLGLPGFRPGARQAPQARPMQSSRDSDEARQRRALAIWHEARDPRGTLVETYLNGRKLDLPDEAAFEVIRFYPRCPFGIERFAAMICLVRNIATNEPQAIQRTALAPDGTAFKREGKTYRLTLGPARDCAIKIDADEHVTMGLVIGEGVETVLSARQKGLGPAWALLGATGVARFPVLAGIEGLHILTENDANGANAKAVWECAHRWNITGHKVLFADPDLGFNDLNDEARGCA